MLSFPVALERELAPAHQPIAEAEFYPVPELLNAHLFSDQARLLLEHYGDRRESLKDFIA